MSDIRAKLLLGTSIGALAMIFVMAVGVDAFKTTTAYESGTILAHATVMAVHPDGSMSYSQSDNLITDAGIDEATEVLWDESSGSTAFDCVRLGVGVGGTQGGLATPLGGGAGTAPQCIGDDDTYSLGTSANNPAGAIVTLTHVFPALDTTDMVPAAGSTVTITEVALLQNPGTGAAIALSSIAITPIGGVVGTIVTITYTLTLT